MEKLKEFFKWLGTIIILVPAYGYMLFILLGLAYIIGNNIFESCSKKEERTQSQIEQDLREELRKHMALSDSIVIIRSLISIEVDVALSRLEELKEDEKLVGLTYEFDKLEENLENIRDKAWDLPLMY